MWPSPFPETRRRRRGFTLLEVAIALVIVALAAASLAIPFSTLVQARRLEETRRMLEEAREALMGFAAAHGRLPCPATAASAGQESFAPGGDSANGDCADFHGGFLPAAALGLGAPGADGLARDPWLAPLRYAVFGAGNRVNDVANPLTRANGMQSATLPGLASASHYLFVCATGMQASASGCGPASRQLTRRAAFVVFSTGPNGVFPPAAGGDEARNLDGDPVFVWREASEAPGHTFDDSLQWVPIHLLASRLLMAGRLP